MKALKKLLVLTYIITIVLIIGCNGNYSKTEEVTFELTNSIFNITALPTLTITPLPINTLTTLERQNFVRESLSNSPDCNLPCWWGITPGETTWKETNDFLNYLGASTSEISGYDLSSILHGAGGFS